MAAWSPPGSGAITAFPARPKLRNKQGQYAVIGMDGQILKRGHDLKTVLRVLERKLIRAIE
jgi:hypothetical protein